MVSTDSEDGEICIYLFNLNNCPTEIKHLFFKGVLFMTSTEIKQVQVMESASKTFSLDLKHSAGIS